MSRDPSSSLLPCRLDKQRQEEDGNAHTEFDGRVDVEVPLTKDGEIESGSSVSQLKTVLFTPNTDNGVCRLKQNMQQRYKQRSSLAPTKAVMSGKEEEMSEIGDGVSFGLLVLLTCAHTTPSVLSA